MKTKKKTLKGIEYEFDKRSIPTIIVFLILILIGISTYLYLRSRRDFSDNSGMIVTTTVFPIFDIVSNITKGSENFIIYQIVTDEDNPLDYNPTVNDEDLIKQSDIIFYLESDYDGWVNDFAQKKTTVANLSDDIELKGLDTSLLSMNYRSICEGNGGTWLDEYDECENLSKEVCYENDGEYSNCVSSCRHEEETELCIQVCVELCDFSNSGTSNESDMQEGSNPYFFLSIENTKKISERVYVELSNISPGDQDVLYQNYLEYLTKLDETNAYIRELVYNWDINEIYVMGYYLDYLANDYGISLNRISQDSIEEYNEHNKIEMIKLIDAYSINSIYVEKNIESQLLDELINEGQIEVIELDVFGGGDLLDTFIATLKFNVRQILSEGN